MGRYAILDDKKTTVVNLVVADNVGALPFADGQAIAAPDGVRLGWGYAGGKFIAP